MIFTKIVLSLISIWALLAIILGLFELQIYFPLNVSGPEQIPYHRMEVLRYAIFATVIYFSIRFLRGGRPTSPLVFLDIFFKFVVFFGVIVWLKEEDLEDTVLGLLGFWALVSFCLHLELLKKRKGYYNSGRGQFR